MITGNTFTSTSGSQLTSSLAAVISDNTFALTRPIRLSSDEALGSAITGNTFATGSAIQIAGTYNADVTLTPFQGLPFELWSDLTVSSGATLTVAAGVEVGRANNSSIELYVSGTLVADGATFTSNEVYIQNGGAFEFRNGALGALVSTYSGAAALVIEQSIVTSRPSISIENHTVVNNQLLAGIQNSGVDLVVAENNWWGSPLGPFHPDLNPQGEGVTVGDGVDFNPWLTEPPEPDTPPDLVPSNLAASPAAAPAGAPIMLSLTVSNAGSDPATASATRFWMSPSSQALGDDDPVLATVATPGLESGGSVDIQASTAVPSDLTPGPYYIWAVVDVNQQSGQEALYNDTLRIPFPVMTGGGGDLPDLTPQDLAVQPTAGPAGSEATVTLTVTNSGSADAPNDNGTPTVCELGGAKCR